MTTTLITGANKGFGFETARRLTEAGHTVYIGVRDERLGFVQLDVNTEGSLPW
jgi:NAD(P)-dependent dehydrogenase (short-subunit alcohol dehydrogenase family)